MDLTAINSLAAASLNGITETASATSLTGSLLEKSKQADGTLFEAILNSAIDNIRTTNDYISDMKNEEMKFMLGESENTHDLTNALQKASTALQYTTAIRDRFLEAYKEIMQIQI